MWSGWFWKDSMYCLPAVAPGSAARSRCAPVSRSTVPFSRQAAKWRSMRCATWDIPTPRSGWPRPPAQSDSEHARLVTLKAEPGPLATFGPIEIVGNSSVSDDVVRRELSYRPGRIFRQSALQSSQRRLYSQALFQFANVEAIRLEGEPTEIPTRVTLTEGKHRKVNFGVGYGSEERARAQIDWRHVNFFGGARTAGVLARYSSLDRGVRLNFTQPYLFSPGYELGLTGQSWQSHEPAYDLTTTGGRSR